VDVSAAALALALTFPLALLVSLAIWLDTRGPVFFTQERVGQGGRPFRMWKFRSMHVDASDRDPGAGQQADPSDGQRCVTRSDPRLTRVGRLLRRFSLDEYPQLLNVLWGHMSMVGPRPHVPAEVAQYSAWQRCRLEVLPGLTGLAQVTGRKDLSVDEMAALDMDYMATWSLRLDLAILLRTVPAVLRGSGAY
jgi:lipopolysaccharide/colanic/teichoic acid biosynthesis glycosyltransferase